MRRILSSFKPSPALAVAVVALVAACGGWAVAATRTAPVIRACANKRSGALRLAAKCRRSERAVSWNKEGVAGAQGPSGAAGAPGATGATGTVDTSGFFTKGEADARYVAQSRARPYAWGQVRADASLRPVSARVKTVTHPTTGLYCVILSGSGVESEPPEPEQSELEGTAVTLAGAEFQNVFPEVTNGQGADCSTEPRPHVSIRFWTSSGTLEDARFSFVVP